MQRALLFATPYKRHVAFIFLLTLLIAAINAIEPLILGWIFNELGADKNEDSLLKGVLVLAAFAIGREIFTAASNIAGTPAISVPYGKDGETGLPLGAQLIAPHYEEERMFRGAQWIEGAAGDGRDEH